MDAYSYHIGCILKVLVYIEEHLEEPLALEQMAKIAHISPFYFHRLFKAYMGETLADYVKRLRVQRAAEKLTYSELPITEIALSAGYDTPSSFTKVFNQVMGESPREYRKKMQPVVQAIIDRTHVNESEIMKPVYVERKEMVVLFVRRVGDYKETPWQAFEAIEKFIKEEGIEDKINDFYSVALDDPHTVDRNKCRFDVCVSLSQDIPAKGEIGKKVLPGGRFAMFTYKGPYSGIEGAFERIFRSWYPASKDELTDDPPFCQQSDCRDPSVPSDQKTTKIYIPLKKT